MDTHLSGKSTRPGYHHGDLEAALVTAALGMIRERGADAVSLRQVAQEVGVSPSAAYAHFPDKDALMAAAAKAGMDFLDTRMIERARALEADDARAAVERFWLMGEEYVGFAMAEPHLFRHIFGPYCPAAEKASQSEGGLASITAEDIADDSVAYAMLCAGLDDLDARGLLRAGVREGLDVTLWSMVHGFACLVLDGQVPPEWQGQVMGSIARLVLVDDVEVPREL